MPHAPLTETSELSRLLESGGVRLIDTREVHDFAKGHIPGAVSMRGVFTYLSTRETGGHSSLVQHFGSLLGGAGIRRDDRVVVYEDAMDNGYGQSCRGWFILKVMGHVRVSVLHGGLRAWKRAGGETTQSTTAAAPVLYETSIDDRLILAREDMLSATRSPDIQILDVRDYAEWVGANSSPYGFDFCPRKGRIPGAKWLEWYRLMKREDGIPWFRTGEETRSVCSAAGVNLEKPIYLYCFKGARTSNVMIALLLAGAAHVRNYFSGWNEWSRDFSLPVDDSYPDEDPRA